MNLKSECIRINPSVLVKMWITLDRVDKVKSRPEGRLVAYLFWMWTLILIWLLAIDQPPFTVPTIPPKTMSKTHMCFFIARFRYNRIH